MKTKEFWLVMLVITLTFGLTVVSCDDNRDNFAGTWNYTPNPSDQNAPPEMNLIAQDGTFKVNMKNNGVFIEGYRGTYTTSEDSVTITFTQVNLGAFSGGSDNWVNYNDVPAQYASALPQPKIVTGTISNGNKFTISINGANIVYTKQS